MKRATLVIGDTGSLVYEYTGGNYAVGCTCYRVRIFVKYLKVGVFIFRWFWEMEVGWVLVLWRRVWSEDMGSGWI